MDDGLLYPYIGEHRHAYHHRLHDRHQPERLRKEQPGEDQVAGETQQLIRAVTEHRPAAGAQYALHELWPELSAGRMTDIHLRNSQ